MLPKERPLPQNDEPYAFMDDFHVGQKFSSGAVTVTAEDIIAFAKQFDPQDFHTDPEKAKDTVVGRHIASGWHTASLTMRLMMDTLPKMKGGILGRTIENLNWPRAVYPGDTLSAEVDILDLRASKSDPARGISRIRTTTRNQKGETVQEMESVIFMPRKGQ